MSKVIWIYDDIFLKHNDPMHPENARRLEYIREHLETAPIKDSLERRTPRKATREEILLNHTEDYVNLVEEVCKKGSGYLDPDTYYNEHSFEVASFAVGVALDAVDYALRDKAKKIFVTPRPPGHHAEQHKPMGFCLFNNIAIAAQYALTKYGLDRIAIFDWDVHHGNGTQHAFEEEPRVYYLSIHQWPHFPGTGRANENGRGRGVGTTLNCPLPPGSGDRPYEKAFYGSIVPAIEDYKPQLILISAGFDAHKLDPLAHMQLTTDFFGKMTDAMCELASKYTDDRVIAVLEGGYNPTALKESVELMLSRMVL